MMGTRRWLPPQTCHLRFSKKSVQGGRAFFPEICSLLGSELSETVAFSKVRATCSLPPPTCLTSSVMSQHKPCPSRVSVHSEGQWPKNRKQRQRLLSVTEPNSLGFGNWFFFLRWKDKVIFPLLGSSSFLYYAHLLLLLFLGNWNKEKFALLWKSPPPNWLKPTVS